MTETSEFRRHRLRLDAIRDLPEGAGPIQFIKDFGDTAALMLTVASPKVARCRSRSAPEQCGAIEQLAREAAPARGSGRRWSYDFPPSISRRRASAGRRAATWPQAVSRTASCATRACSRARASSGSSAITDARRPRSSRHARRASSSDRLRAAEFHPDAWQPAIVRDPAATRSEPRWPSPATSTPTASSTSSPTCIEAHAPDVPQVAKVDRSGVLAEQVFLELLAGAAGRVRHQPWAGFATSCGPATPRCRGGTDRGRRPDGRPSTRRGEFRDEREIGDVIVGSSSGGAPLYLRDLVDMDRDYQSPPRFLNYYTWQDAAGRWQRSARDHARASRCGPGEQIGDFGHAVDAALADAAAPAPARPDPRPHVRPAAAGRREHRPFMSSLYEAIVPGRARRAHRLLGVALGAAAWRSPSRSRWR